MANTSFTQNALANDASFAVRVRGLLIAQALIVLTEGPPVQSDPVTPQEAAAMNVHLGRQNYARQVLDDSERATRQAAPILVTRTNLVAFETSYDFPSSRVVTASGDLDIAAQIAADWNIFARV